MAAASAAKVYECSQATSEELFDRAIQTLEEMDSTLLATHAKLHEVRETFPMDSLF